MKFCLLPLALFLACSGELPTAPSSARQAASESAGRSRRHAAGGAACVNISGVYDVTYQGSCRTEIYMPVWTIEQSGCSVRTPLIPDIPTVIGTVDGSNIRVTMRNGFTTCQYTLDAQGQFAGGVITATATGPITGCCSASTETLQIVAKRR